MALKHQAEKKFSESKDKCEAVKLQALSTCTVGEWSSFLNILALATVISRPLSSVYPDFNFCYRKLLHRAVMPRLLLEKEISSGQVSILWSRARRLDNHPGTWFQPNHFAPIINKRELNDRGREKHDKSSKSSNTVKPTSQPTLFSFQRSLAHPIKHHPASQFTKEPWKWLEWGTAVRPRKNQNHQQQMWAIKENSSTSGKRNPVAYIFGRKQQYDLQHLPSSTRACREITVYFSRKFL